MNNKISPQIVVGLIVLFLGAGFLLDALNIWNFGAVLGRWWPLLIIGIGLLNLLNQPQNRPSALITIGFGVLLQLWLLNTLPVSLWSLLWPVLVIIIGLLIVLGRPERVISSSDQTLNASVIFSGIDRKIEAREFKDGNITVFFGGAKLDFSGTTFTEDATLHIFAAFGGVDIRLPENCHVKIVGTPIFGGWEDQTKAPSEKEKAHVLIIKGTALFGGVRVTN